METSEKPKDVTSFAGVQKLGAWLYEDGRIFLERKHKSYLAMLERRT